MAGPPDGALRHVAGDLRLELDVSDAESAWNWEDGEDEGSRMVVERDLTGWSHGRRGRGVIKKADFEAARNLFGVSARGVRSGGLGGVGTVGSVPAPSIGGAVQVEPALPLTPRRASPGGGEGRGAGEAEGETDMGGTGSGALCLHPLRWMGGVGATACLL